jgi:hypothetical protein
LVQTSVELWISPPGKLVVDSDKDSLGICDAINESIAQYHPLDALAPRGDVYWGDGTGDSVEPIMSGSCDYKQPPATSPPPTLCADNNSDLSYIMTHPAHGNGKYPVIFAFQPSSGTSSELCTGSNFEVTQVISSDYEGWVCAAARGIDAVGNTGVSEPIAFCFDNPSVAGTPSCWGQGAGSAPSCSDGCTPVVFSSSQFVADK